MICSAHAGTTFYRVIRYDRLMGMCLTDTLPSL